MDGFKQLYIENKDFIFGYLLKMTGDYDLSCDVMQESFLKYFEKYGNRQVNRAFLVTMARNLMIDKLRRKKRVFFLDEKLESGLNQEDVLIIREEFEQVLNAMRRLEDDEREILVLVGTGELSYKEIAEIISTTEGNIKIKVHRARKKLKTILLEGK